VVRAEWLSDLYVENWARNRGIGRCLVRHVAKVAAASGAETMHWNVLRRNAAARRFYGRFAKEDVRLLHCLVEGKNLPRLAGTTSAGGIAMRHALPGDAPWLGQMLNALLAALGEPQFGFDAGDRLRRDGFSAKPRFEAIIAEQDGEAVAY